MWILPRFRREVFQQDKHEQYRMYHWFFSQDSRHFVFILLLLLICASASAATTTTTVLFQDHPNMSDQQQPQHAQQEEKKNNNKSAPFPSFYIPHGGGPSFFLPNGLGGMLGPNSPTAIWLKNFQTNSIPSKPDAIVIFSAHWESEADQVQVNIAKDPGLLYDYGGFPAETYQLEYPVQTDVALAEEVIALLKKSTIPVKPARRKFDHGVFIPLKLMFPDADVPLVQVSLMSHLDPDFHVKIGAALRSLTDNGRKVMFLGSGSSSHGFFLREDPKIKERGALKFDEWLYSLCDDNKENETKSNDKSSRTEKLINWKDAPGAALTHPREEHLVPLFCVAGAAGDQAKMTRVLRAMEGGVPLVSLQFN